MTVHRRIFIAPVCCLMVSTPLIQVLIQITYSFTDPAGMESWVSLVGWPIADSLPTKWSPVNYRSGTAFGKELHLLFQHSLNKTVMHKP